MVFKHYVNRYKKRFTLEKSVLQGFLALQAGAATLPIDIEMCQAWRGQVEQEQAFNTGHSNARWGQSPHGYGIAFDVGIVINGILSWPEDDDPRWAQLGEIADRIGLQWGGLFKSYKDVDHFEIMGFHSYNYTLYPQEPPVEG